MMVFNWLFYIISRISTITITISNSNMIIQLFTLFLGNKDFGYVGNLDPSGKCSVFNDTTNLVVFFGLTNNKHLKILYKDGAYTFQVHKKAPRPRRDLNGRFIEYSCIKYDTISDPITHTSITPEQAFDIVKELVQKYEM